MLCSVIIVILTSYDQNIIRSSYILGSINRSKKEQIVFLPEVQEGLIKPS